MYKGHLKTIPIVFKEYIYIYIYIYIYMERGRENERMREGVEC